MKKILIILCILFTFDRVCLAPEYNSLYIQEAPILFKTDQILRAFMFVESSFDIDTVNKLGYGGILQIGQEMIDETNRICKIRKLPFYFVLKDRLSKDRSELIWIIVQDFHNPQYDVKKACKIWNPKADHRYYDRIKKAITLKV